MIWREFLQSRTTSDTGLSTLGRPEGWLSSIFGGLPTEAGVTISERSSMSLSAVWTCVNIRCGLVASLPWKVYERLPTGGRRLARELREYEILHNRPSSEDTAYTLRHRLLGNLLLWGNCYAVIQTDGRGMVNALWPYHPEQVRVKYGLRRGEFSYIITGMINGEFTEMEVQKEDMIHLRGFSHEGLNGLSVIQNYRRGLGLAVATETFASNFYRKGAMSTGVLQYPGRLTKTGQQNLAQSFDEQHAGVENAGRTIVLEEGTKYIQLSVPQDDAQFIETRKMSRSEVAGLFRIPTMLVPGAEDKSPTYASSEVFNRQLVDFTLRDDLTMIQNEFNSKLFAGTNFYCEFDLRDLLRGDMAARAAYWKARWEVGSINADEIRDDENENPIAGGFGKKYYVQTSYRDISQPLPVVNPVPSPALPVPKPPQSKAGMKKLFSNIVKEIRAWGTFNEKRAASKFKGSLVEPLAAELNCESEKVIEYCSQSLASRALTLRDDLLEAELNWLAGQLLLEKDHEAA